MYKNIKKDKKLRLSIRDNELNKFFLRYLTNNLVFNDHARIKAQIQLNSLEKGFRSKLNSRCIYTGRGRGVFSKFKVSRMTFRKLASNGCIKGVRKVN